MEQKAKDQARSQEYRRSLVGFLSVEPTSDNAGLIGAILVTDERGYPLEFRCTTPVRPTAIQKTLYGALLKPYVSVELCGKRLLAEVQRKPALVVTPSLSPDIQNPPPGDGSKPATLGRRFRQ